MAQNIPIDVQAPPFRWFVEHFQGAGVDNFSSETTPSEIFNTLDNVMPITTGAILRRWGYSLFDSSGTATGTYPRFNEYTQDSTGNRYLLLTSLTNPVRALTETGGVRNNAVFTPNGSATEPPRFAASRGFAYFADGASADLIKWDGSAAGGTSKWGIVSPATAPSVSAPVAAGAITINKGRTYFVAFVNSATGHTSGLSPASASSGPLAAQNINLTSIAVSADAQVDTKVILATADGDDQTTLYALGTIANATTTYTDNTVESTLLSANIYVEKDDFGNLRGLFLNSPPPSNGTNPIKHQGRLFLLNGQFINFSKSLDECLTSTGLITARYEECWPATYQVDISTRAETPRAMLSDGTTLYIGTERHVRKLEGQGPDFGNAEIAFNEVGVLSQEVWRVVFSEGQPVGTMWLSPDRRVFIGNLTDYMDVGTPVQTLLNTINMNVARTTAHAAFYSDGEYDLYCLALPLGSSTVNNKMFVYNLRTRKWVTWTLTDAVSSMLFTTKTTTGDPQWLFSSANNSNHTYKLVRGLTQDRVSDTPANIIATLTTNWEPLGDGTARKLLNEIEVVTGDSGLVFTVSGAGTVADFASPVLVKTGTIVQSPMGEYKGYLAGSPSKHRYYQFNFVSNSTVSTILESLSVYCVPVNRT